ncbi:hypothetical protein [Lentzea flaviverrucosa]|uniref:Conserved repeat domain-containing protein n=1 Tax=Lentzea flaviverrucosa TaxID=200379 RepID=A0A1H9FDG5_9PSEU|nr:hypothetical protein [Lentzea flaviverrucosa]RDI35227.1 putative repeat protein (TIGR01451 family) [Lentzea flaviverrucosa]SEQ35949.1 conserved repeat domain-containing protein [Lentzea flaviverrucosa]
MRVPILIAVVLLVPLLTPGPPVAAAEVWRTQFDEAVYGDVTVVGNSVLTCPTPEQAGPDPKYSPKSCVDALHRKGHGPSALNNGHRMSWTDVDDDPATVTSSSAQLAIPAGATVAYAKLGWAGSATCRDDVPPPGTPRDPVTFNGTRVSPGRFVIDGPDGLSHTDNAFYSAEADVTRALTSGTVTVGNVWAPQGFDCFGGWSLTVVWKFANATAAAPAKRHVAVHGGHVRLPTGKPVLHTPIAPTHPTGGDIRVGVTAYEGDWATDGDQMLVNGTAVGGRNAFVSSAQGAAYPNNMSVDARTVTVDASVLKPGTKSADLAFRRDEDAFLVQSIAWSFPLPELTLTVDPATPVAHPKDTVAQTATVTNAGDAPATGVTVCGQQVGTIAPRATATRTCSSTAADDDYPTTVAASGTSLAGDPLAAQRSSTVDVLHPALRATTATEPVTALPGQAVKFTTTVTNTGDTPLYGLAARAAAGCDPMQGQLDPGATSKVDCTAPAGDESGALTATVSAADRIGGKVEASASVRVEVIYPRLTISAVWSKDRARDGEVVTVTVTVGNPSGLPIENVQVNGEPAACRRTFAVLPPRSRVTYTCQVTAPMNSRLTVSGAGAGGAIGESAVVRIESLSAPLPPDPEPPAPAPDVPAPPRPVAHVQQVSKPAVGGVAAIIGMIGMVVVASALSGLGRR